MLQRSQSHETEALNNNGLEVDSIILVRFVLLDL